LVVVGTSGFGVAFAGLAVAGEGSLVAFFPTVVVVRLGPLRAGGAVVGIAMR
jgi:hypothetical protein